MSKRRLWASILFGLIGSILAVSLFGGIHTSLSILEVRIRLLPSVSGVTEFRFPPFGSAIAKTHDAPVRIQIDAENLQMKDFKGLLQQHLNHESIKQDIVANAKDAFIKLAVFSILLGALGGLLLCALIIRKIDAEPLATSAVAGALLWILLITLTLGTYQKKALENPTFSGFLKGIPWAVKIVQGGYIHLDTLDSSLQSASERMSSVYEQLSKLSEVPDSKNETRILVISDIHNNVIAIRLVKKIANLFKIDTVVNSGDLTELGTHFEQEITSMLSIIPQPQVFATGNHDSTQVMEAARKIPQLHVMDGNVQMVKGIQYLGIPDPCSLTSGPQKSMGATPQQVRDAQIQIAGILAKSSPKPDILVVHEPDITKPFYGKVPIIINGHTHTLLVENQNGSLVVNPGTTGASGIHYFLKDTKCTQISALIIHMTKGTKPTPTAVDTIEYNPISGDFIFRHLRMKHGVWKVTGEIQ